MGNAAGVVKRKATSKPKTPDTADQKRFKAAVAMRGSVIRRCKQLMDRASVEAYNVEKEIEKILPKGYPHAITEFFSEKVKEFQAVIASIQEKYAVEASRVDKMKPETVDVETSAASVDNMMQSLDQHFKRFKDGVANDIKKLAT